jgi:hypothetical protein
VSTVLASFRCFQAPDQIISVCILQDTFGAMESTPDTLSLGLVKVSRSSIEAFSDEPVAPHNRHYDIDAATHNMDFLTTYPRRFPTSRRAMKDLLSELECTRDSLVHRWATCI